VLLFFIARESLNKITHFSVLLEVVVVYVSCTGLDHSLDLRLVQSSISFPSLSKTTLIVVVRKKIRASNYVGYVKLSISCQCQFEFLERIDSITSEALNAL